MKVTPQHGVPLTKAHERLYERNIGGKAWLNIILELDKLFQGVDGCLTEKQFEALRRKLSADQELYGELHGQMSLPEAAKEFALQKAPTIVGLARLKCRNCLLKDECELSDVKPAS